jgi:NO-binding membrane sensor protein with MHYT domain
MGSMFRVLTCLAFEHNWWLVVLAGVVCLLASHRDQSVHRAPVTRGRTNGVDHHHRRRAGCGIWATRIIAMLAYDPGVVVGYDIPLTALWWRCVITGLGFRLRVRAGDRRPALAARWSAAELRRCTTSVCTRLKFRGTSAGRSRSFSYQ